MNGPRIGVTGVVRVVDGIDRTGVNASYVNSILQAGGLPFILSPLLGTHRGVEALSSCEALVLTGGEDVDPAVYGQEPSPHLGPVDRIRDAFELALVEAALLRRLPVLGICRGIQVVNVALGGTLWQDLPTERPSTVGHTQGSGRAARTHRIDVVPGTRAARALGITRFSANSFHHQAIRDLAPGLIASAVAEDGLIEAVELEADAPWLVAVQWHPEEFHAEREAPDQGLFQAVVRQGKNLAD